ncbi:MAG: glycosyltransferase family 9 protein [Ignavibacteriaceae bacterium]
MAKENIFSQLINSVLKKIFSVLANKSLDIGNPQKILIVRQHNQLGDLLTGVSLFRAIKEKFPKSTITLIVSPFNYPGLIKNKFIDRIFIFDKKKLFNPFYLFNVIKLIREEYDVAIVPVVVSISFTSNLISRLSNSKIRIGPESLDGKINKSAYLFDRRVKIDWRKHPDSNVSERSLDIIRPFGINTQNYRSEITFDENDEKIADEFIFKLGKKKGEILIGLHVGAGKPPNRWSLEKYRLLINQLKEKYKTKFYLTGSSADKEEINFLKNKLNFEIGLFVNKKIPQVAALISKSDLFISNDTGIMHVAGTTDTPQISIFGPTNPFNWAPIGSNKYFIRRSELIDDVSVKEVFDLCEILLTNNNNNEFIA